MPIIVTPDEGIPVPKDKAPEELDNFTAKARAYLNTVEVYAKAGADISVEQADKAESHQIFASKKLIAHKDMTPGTIINLNAILNEWDQEVINVAARLRNYVTNKLIQETIDSDPRQRIKALELLGRMSTVGLFSDKLEVNVTNRSLSDIENELKKTISLYGRGSTDVEDVSDSKPSKNKLKDIIDDYDD